jgi:hypothetical protein
MKKSLLTLSAVLAASVSFSQIIISENFNGTSGTAIPATWTQVTSATDGGYKSGTNTGLSSSNFAVPSLDGTRIVGTNDDGCNCNKANERLISPVFDLSSATSAVLDVNVFFAGGTYQSVTETAKIDISTDGGTTWTLLSNLTGVSTGWQDLSISLASYLGNNNVKISFVYNDNGGWLFGFFVDNFVVRQPSQDDIKLTDVSLNRYSMTNTNNTLGLAVKNNGSNPITSITVDWNDGTSHSATLSCNIAAGATSTVNHTTAVNYAAVIEESIDVTITQVNGNVDPNSSDNAYADKLFNTLSQLADKAVVIEEGTGTWCGWCPRGAVAMEDLIAAHPNDFIGVAVHNGDPMTLTEYDNGADLSGFPGCNVDRALLDQGVSSAAFESYYQERIDLVVPAAINLVASGAGSSVTVDVTATFYTPFAASNYRLGVIITEDNVTGTTSGYNQTNYYDGGGAGALNGAGHDWTTAGDPVPAANMEYDHVGRALLGGYAGQAGSVPAAITDGQVVNYSFNYTVPATSTRIDMHAIAVLIDQTTGEIVNAKQISIAQAGIEEASSIGMEVYPNPASAVVNVKFEGKGGEYTIAVTDLAGRQVAFTSVANANGSQLVALPINGLSAGNYLITVANNGASYTQNLMIK